MKEKKQLIHIDEAMSWETVRNLRRMPPLLLQIRNIFLQGGAAAEIIAQIGEVEDVLRKTFTETVF